MQGFRKGPIREISVWASLYLQAKDGENDCAALDRMIELFDDHIGNLPDAKIGFQMAEIDEPGNPGELSVLGNLYLELNDGENEQKAVERLRDVLNEHWCNLPGADYQLYYVKRLLTECIGEYII